MDQYTASIEELRDFEESLWRAETRFDREYMERILTSDFFEIGCSGRVYTRGEILAPPAQAIAAKLPLDDFEVHPIAEQVVQVTYTTSEVGEREVRTCRRSSIWIATAQGWRLRYHQGTVAA